MSDFYIRGIPAPFVERMWEFAEPYVKRALDHAAGEIGPNDLKQSCLEREAQLWLVSHENRIVGAATTEIAIYPKKKHCRVITIAGACFFDWVHLMDATLEAFAIGEGCDSLEAHVRKGFVQKLAPLGYRHLHSVVIKNLNQLPAIKEDPGDPAVVEVEYGQEK